MDNNDCLTILLLNKCIKYDKTIFIYLICENKNDITNDNINQIFNCLINDKTIKDENNIVICYKKNNYNNMFDIFIIRHLEDKTIIDFNLTDLTTLYNDQLNFIEKITHFISHNTKTNYFYTYYNDNGYDDLYDLIDLIKHYKLTNNKINSYQISYTIKKIL